MLKITFLAIAATGGGILSKILAFLDSPFRASRFDILLAALRAARFASVSRSPIAPVGPKLAISGDGSP